MVVIVLCHVLFLNPILIFSGWNFLSLHRTSEIMRRQMRELAAAGAIKSKQKDKGTWRSAMAKIISLDNLLDRIVERSVNVLCMCV